MAVGKCVSSQTFGLVALGSQGGESSPSVGFGGSSYLVSMLGEMWLESCCAWEPFCLEVLLGRLNLARNAQGQQEEKIAKKKAEKAEKALNPEPPKEEPSAGESLDDLVVECSTCSVQFPWAQLAEGHQGASDIFSRK